VKGLIFAPVPAVEFPQVFRANPQQLTGYIDEILSWWLETYEMPLVRINHKVPNTLWISEELVVGRHAFQMVG